MYPLYSRHVSALILGHHQVNIRAEACREYRVYIIKYFVNCCEKEGIIYTLMLWDLKLSKWGSQEALSCELWRCVVQSKFTDVPENSNASTRGLLPSSPTLVWLLPCRKRQQISFWPPATRWFLARLILHPEDGSDTFLRNVGSHTDYENLYPRRQQHS
jgi:hypothetical protein